MDGSQVDTYVDSHLDPYVYTWGAPGQDTCTACHIFAVYSKHAACRLYLVMPITTMRRTLYSMSRVLVYSVQLFLSRVARFGLQVKIT
jgi:hypothetical protein